MFRILILSRRGTIREPPPQGPARNTHYAQYERNELKSFPRGPVHPSVTNEMQNADRPPFMRSMLGKLAAMQNDRESMANFASQNSVVDDGVGKVLAALDRDGLSGNTLVVFSSDQGNFYGQHGLWGHTITTIPSNLYETAMRVPLIFRHTDVIKAGETSNLMVGQYDIMPTILDYAGLPDVEIKDSPGRSFAGTL